MRHAKSRRRLLLLLAILLFSADVPPAAAWPRAANADIPPGAHLGVGPTAPPSREPLVVGQLTVETLTNPLGIDTPAPRLGWIVEANHNGAEQTAYEIRVSTTKSTDGNVWSSGRVDSADSYQVEYAGPTLRSRTRYYWAVRVWGNTEGDQPSPWSEIGWFETAFLKADEFGGQWINRDGEVVAPREEPEATPLPEVLLRKEFTLDDEAIVSGRAYVAGLGYHKVYVNGSRVGDHELDPAFTRPDKRVLYVTHDVTQLLRRGTTNAIGVSLGNGWHTRNPELKLELDVTYDDGTSDRIVTDQSWRVDDGPTLANDVRRGETYDARREKPGWTQRGFDDAGWTRPVVQKGPVGDLVAQTLPPIRVTGQLHPPVTMASPTGGTIYDFQTTRAGWATVSFRGPEGAEVSMRYGEKLNDDGTVHNNDMQAYTYILRGDGEESFTPSYSYNGYRYVQIDAPDSVTINSVVGKLVNTDAPTTGEFVSSSELLNRYHEAMQASQLSNFHGFPTDTPMYEKNGWTGDGHINSDNALINFGSESFWEKWMIDHRDSQAANGTLPVTLPRPREPRAAPIWTYSYIHINWALYENRGNVRTLQENYDGMKRWLEFYESVIEPTGYLYEGFTFGDHEAAQGGPNRPVNAIFPAENDNVPLGTAFIYDAANKMVKIAEVLGRNDDAARFQAFADKIRHAYVEAVYDTKTRTLYDPREPDVYQQSTNAVALAFGLVPEEDRQAIFDNLAFDVRETWKGHVSVGAVGVKFILRMLTEGGYADLAYDAATTPTYPGWGWWFQSLHGLWTGTERIIVDTHWEAWRWFRSRSVIDSSRSHNHAFRGVIDDWLYEDIAGIEPLAPAYRRIEIKPTLVGDLTSAAAYTTTPLGRVSSAWEITGAFLTLQVHVPVGANAVIMVPIEEGGEVSQRGGASFVETRDAYAVYESDSGDYIFWTPHNP